MSDDQQPAGMLMLESLGQPVYTVDTAGRCTFINGAAAAALGYEIHALLGTSIQEVIHYRLADGRAYRPNECPVLDTVRTGERRHVDYELYWRRDGESFPVEYTASALIQNETVVGAVVSFADITARRQTLLRLGVQHAVSEVLGKTENFDTASTELLKAIGEALDWKLGIVWILDRAEQVLRCNALWHPDHLRFPKFIAKTRSLALRKGSGLPGQAWMKSGPVFSSNIAEEEDFLRTEEAWEEGVLGALAFPIQGGQFIGVIEFFSDRLRSTDEELLHTIGTLGRQIGQFVDRRRAEVALHESEARKAWVFHSSLDAIVSINQRSQIIDWNEAAEKMFGYAKSAVMGKDMADLIMPPAARSNHREGVKRYLATGHGPILDRRIELTAMRADGGEFPVELAITSIRLGKGVMFTAFLRDISERRAAEQALIQRARLATYSAEVGIALTTEDELRGMLQRCTELTVKHLDASFARIWTLDSEGSVLELQASAGLYTHLDGAHARVPVGQFKIGLIARARMPHMTNRVQDDPRVSDKEWAAREGMVSFAGYPLLVEDKLMGVVAMFSKHAQTTEILQALGSAANGIALGIQRRNTEVALNLALEAAGEANLAKSQFLANMSHELRTPLNAVILYSELLQEEAEDRGAREFLPDLEKIRGAGQHLLSLINNILDLSKIEAGKMELYLESFDVATMVEDVVSIARPLVEKNSNTLIVNCAEELGAMHGDLTKARQLLLNLLSNAAKFTEKGRVSLTVKRVPTDGADWLRFEVADTGIGMTEDQVGNLFQVFSQADASTTRRYGGTGLGLAISKRLSGMMGGDIRVQTRLGFGTTFIAELPAVHASVDGTVESRPEREVDKRPSVLVIDDDPAVRETMMRILTKERYRVYVAHNGEEALTMAKKLHPDVITLDVVMPHLDGWAVLKAFKADPELAEIPIIMLTMMEEKNLAYMLGAADYMTKPVERVRLLEILKKLCPDLHRGSVLVVDDQEAARRSMRQTLEQNGWDVTEAENGRFALESLAAAQPDLILLDLMMPEMDGFQFMAELRGRDHCGSIPVVAVTAKDLTAEDRELLSGYVVKVLQKGPSFGNELLREISALLSQREAGTNRLENVDA